MLLPDLSTKVSRKRAVFWRVGAGWTSNVILAVQGLVLLPLYLHFLGDRLYGFWLASGGALALLAMVDVGGGAVTRQRCAAAFANKNLQAVTSYFWHGLVVTVPVLLLFGSLVVGLAWVLPGWLGADAEFHRILTGCFLLVGLAGALNLLNMLLREFSSALQRPAVPVVAQCVGDLLSLVVLVLSLLGGLGLWSVAIGAIVRSAVATGVSIVYTSLLLRATGARNHWSREIFRDYLTATPAVFGAKLSGGFAQNLPAILLTRSFGPEMTVIYTVTIRVLQMMEMFINCGIHSLYAATGHLFNDPGVTTERKAKIVRNLVVGFSFSATAAFFFYGLINQGFVHLWTSSDYFAGQLFTGLAALASFLVLGNRVLEAFTSAIGALTLSALTGTAERIFRVACFLVLIPWLGVLGVPIAVLITQILLPLGYLKVIRTREPWVARAASPLLVAWLPLAALLVATYPMARVLVADSWSTLVPLVVVAGLAISLLLLLGLPDLKKKLWKHAMKGFAALRTS